MPAFCGDHQPRAHLRLALRRAHSCAGHSSISIDERREGPNAGYEIGPRRDRGLDEQPIELAALEGGAVQTARVVGGDRHAAGPRHEHAGHRVRPPAHRGAHAEAIEDGERAGIDRVAAELRARKRGGVDEPHARTRAREHEGRDAARRPCADDEDVWGNHGRITT